MDSTGPSVLSNCAMATSSYIFMTDRLLFRIVSLCPFTLPVGQPTSFRPSILLYTSLSLLPLQSLTTSMNHDVLVYHPYNPLWIWPWLSTCGIQKTRRIGSALPHIQIGPTFRLWLYGVAIAACCRMTYRIQRGSPTLELWSDGFGSEVSCSDAALPVSLFVAAAQRR